MTFIAFLTTWFWYVMAFAAGALVAWLVARQVIPAESSAEAIDNALQERAARDAAGDDSSQVHSSSKGSRS